MLNEFYWQLLQSCKDQRSKPQESIRKPKKPRVCSTVFEFNSLTHDDQSADECCPIHFVQLEESNSKLDSKSPLSNKSIFLFDFLTNCLPACQQLGELPAVSQRKHFELCTCFFFLIYFYAEQFIYGGIKYIRQGWSVRMESLGICNRHILHFILCLNYFSWVNIMAI